MVNQDKIRQKVGLIETNLKKMEILKQQGTHEFLTDFRNVEAAKHLLQISIETMSDICDHIVARNRLGTPENSADGFRILARHNYLDSRNLDNYVAMVKFRNKVVHLYYEIDDNEIYKILQNNLDDFKTFITEILKII